ncbi:unnamed protein product [Acanthoscelides obtectus]|uniref:Uncharacterized protein n=1 Tax=Acanthoscelides obtectus TaxID=200917 RepID=A0A9P0Q0S8_ACAOB|nr:unnamed protein product [Acanthoscelides obtectus]CAK1679585.1 hypothetical protein AOBTE_LOCUS32369 [Acanthoscelides obtectus]
MLDYPGIVVYFVHPDPGMSQAPGLALDALIRAHLNPSPSLYSPTTHLKNIFT